MGCDCCQSDFDCQDKKFILTQPACEKEHIFVEYNPKEKPIFIESYFERISAMDAIQKALIKIGRKDLAQEYYIKVADRSNYSASDWVKQVEIMLKKIHTSLDQIKKDKAVHAGTHSDLNRDMKSLVEWMKELDKGIKED